jgi:hypothetical protein
MLPMRRMRSVPLSAGAADSSGRSTGYSPEAAAIIEPGSRKPVTDLRNWAVSSASLPIDAEVAVVL